MDILKWNISINKHKTRRNAANNLNLWNHLKFTRKLTQLPRCLKPNVIFQLRNGNLFRSVRFPLLTLPLPQMGLGLLVCSWLTRLL